MKSVFVTDSQILGWGAGGNVVSHHELQALTRVSEVTQILQRVGTLFFEPHYPRNPFMYDYFMASLLDKPEEIELAHFYGASFNLCAKRLYKAKRFATVPAHNLEESLREWANFPWQPPPPHLTDDTLFRYLVHGLQEDHVITPSKNSQRYLKWKLGIDATVIPHGVDLPETWDVLKPEFNVLHISQFGPDKGQIYLIKAWKRVQELADLHHLGKMALDMVCQSVTESKVKNIKYLKFHGYVSEEQKAQLYRLSSVYVQPSVTEGWGLTVGEAMSYGLPAIVTEGTGAVDMVEDGKNGFVIPIRNPDKIAELLIYYYNNPSEVKRMGRNARQTAERYEWGNIEQQYIKLWQSL